MWDRDEILDGGYGFGFRTTSFRQIDPVQEVEMVKHLFTALAPVVQPIALYAWVRCTDPEVRIVAEPDVFPSKPIWYLRETAPFTGEDLDVKGQDSVTRLTSRIEAKDIEHWLLEALDQKVAGKLLYVEHLHMYSSRARLVSHWRRRRGRLLLFDMAAHQEVKIPIETRRDGRWVSGPGYGIPWPPIDVRVTSGDGSIHVSFVVTWTPWADMLAPESEYEAFCDCLKSFFGPGWAYSGLPGMFAFLR